MLFNRWVEDIHCTVTLVSLAAHLRSCVVSRTLIYLNCFLEGPALYLVQLFVLVAVNCPFPSPRTIIICVPALLCLHLFPPSFSPSSRRKFFFSFSSCVSSCMVNSILILILSFFAYSLDVAYSVHFERLSLAFSMLFTLCRVY